jgi:hypothetical protein
MSCIKYIVFIFCCISLTLCRNSVKRRSKEVQDNKLIKIDQSNLLVGEWYYSFPFYSSELTLNPDGSFKFHNQGCAGHGYTEGRWKDNEGELILTSYSKYNQEVRPSDMKAQITPIELTHKNSKLKNIYTIDSSSFNVTVSFKKSDTSNIYFRTKKFRISQGALIDIDENGKETDAIYRSSKSIINLNLSNIFGNK